MDLLTIFFVIVIIVLGYFLVKKNVKPENTAIVENKSNKNDLSKRVIIEELEDQFFALDRYNQIKYLNKSAKQRFGQNLIDKNISTVIRDTKLLESIEKTIETQVTQNIDIEINLPSYQLYKIYIIPGPTYLFPEKNSVVLFLKDFTEITKAQKFKTDFVANVSHELRTPLVSIKSSLETILGPASDDAKAQKKFMKIMSDQVVRMENLINDLLILSRIELEEHIKPNQIVDINDIVLNIKSNFELPLKKKKLN
jgi:Signal transduction histidine kinase